MEMALFGIIDIWYQSEWVSFADVWAVAFRKYVGYAGYPKL